MVGVDKDRKEKIVGEMIQRDVPLMTSRHYGMMRGGFAMPMVSSSVLVVTVQCVYCLGTRFLAVNHVEIM